MYINNINITISNNNKWLDKLVDSFNTPSFTETFVKVYDRFRNQGATTLQWKALRNMFRDVFSKETKYVWRGILTTMQKTCITFPNEKDAISFLWNGDVVSDNGDYHEWIIRT